VFFTIGRSTDRAYRSTGFDNVGIGQLLRLPPKRIAASFRCLGEAASVGQD
jgi:hypothetical protein